MTEISDRSVSIGRIFSRAFGVMGNNPLVIFGVALLFGAGPQLLYNGFLRSSILVQTSNPITTTAVGSLALFLVSLVARSVVTGCITRATVAYSQGRRASLGDCLSVAISRILPVLAVSFIFGIMVVLGMIFLLVPGIIFAVMWSVVVPITVEERAGIFGAFNRSQQLTKGARWKIFGLFLLMFLIGLGVGLVAILATVLTMGISYQAPAIAQSLPAIIANAIVLTVVSALSSALVTSLFVELREWKDGPEDSKLSDIFA